MEYQKELLTIIHKYIPTCKVYLFGSRARNKHHAGSDIDLAIDAKQLLGIGIIGNIKEEIEESTIPYFVDIVDLNNVDEAMKEEILKDGILWSN